MHIIMLIYNVFYFNSFQNLVHRFGIYAPVVNMPSTTATPTTTTPTTATPTTPTKMAS